MLDGFVIETVNAPFNGPVSSPSAVAETETVERSASSLIVVMTDDVPSETLMPVELDGADKFTINDSFVSTMVSSSVPNEISRFPAF